MKPKGPLLFAVAASLYLLGALLSPQEAAAAVATVNNWPATPQALLNGVSTGAKVASASGTVTVGAGTNRAMMVVVACEYSAAPSTQKLSVSYGTKSISPVATNISQRSTIWLGYLNETDLAAEGTGKTLLVKNNNATNLIAMYASAAVFSGVDQSSSPISGYSTQATASAISMTPPAYNVTAQAANAGLSLVVANWNGGTLTPPTGYTASPATYAGSNFSLGFYNKSITVTGNETPVPVTSAANSGAMVGFGLVPSGLKYTITTCADCHYFYPVDAPTTRGTPTGQFKGSHNKHAGSADGQYGYDCTRCHYNATTTSHSQGYKNISGSSVARNSYGGTTNIPVTNNEASFATCTKSTCHSTGRSNIQYATTVTWGTNGTTTCLSCHAGRAAGNGNPANSAAGFKLSTTHSQHLKLPYTAANINCNMCHSRTASDAQTLKTYSGVMYHANGRADVIFGDINYGSYTSYKSSGADAGKCANVACHGGKTRSPWTNQGAINTTNVCTNCHGQPQAANISPANTDRKNFAPGWVNGANTGTSTDQNTADNDVRVGAHFAHLSSVYMPKIKCNECHRVPSTPFEATHMTGPRYNSQSVTFAQASTATKNGLSGFTTYTSGTATKAATCGTTYCHGSKLKNGDTAGTARKPSWDQNTLMARTPDTTTCGRCHGFPPNSVTSNHNGLTLLSQCATCHNSVVDSLGNIKNKTLHINGLVEATSCTGCHGNPPVDSTIGTSTGLATPATNATSPGAHAAHVTNMSMTCATCHNNSRMPSTTDQRLFIQFKINAANYPYWKSGTTAPFGSFSGQALSASYVGYSTGATKYGLRASGFTCNNYCHATWANNGGSSSNPTWGTASTGQCGTCHFTSNATVPATAPGSHTKHAGSTNYNYKCSYCHSRVSSITQHVEGVAKVKFNPASTTSQITAGATYRGTVATTNPVASAGLGGIAANYGSCGNLYCHSSGRGLGTLQYSSAKWGGGAKSCLSCHGGRNGANYAKSVGGFSLSTTHGQHLGKYPAANINCNECHSKTASDAATLKQYTGILRHVNGKRDVDFSSNATYGTYTSYKTTGANQGKCANVSCHGGISRGVWSATTINTDNTCVHCHGTATTSSALANTAANRKFFAPGYKNAGKIGTSTDQVVNSNDNRVGSHFKHISSAYMKSIKCNECHTVPNNVFDGTHMGASSRYNSQTLTFGQASTARILIGVDPASTPAQLSTFSGYTNGTATKAATCSSVYCHGNRLKNGDTGGSPNNTYRKPYWNYSAMINYTNKDQACGRCHGNPPSSVSAQHSGKTATTSCSTCHSSVVNAAGDIINKNLHINGKVEATAGHAFPYPGATHSLAAGATTPSSNCSCHDYTNAGTYPVGAGTAPNCKACHTVGLLRTVATSSCYDCHGSGAAASAATPNGGTAFPNWSGSHGIHVTGQGMACSDCHANGGTGNTAHGHSNGTAKTRTTVNVQNGGTAVFTYTAASQTCSAVSCHGNAVWSVTQFDCVSCHAAAVSGRRQITGTGGDFLRNSHHVTSGTLSKWHCIICHAEGNTSTGSTNTLHKNGSVELRNVDTPGNPGTAGTNYWSIPNTKAAADYTNIDNFCFKCHDAVGSASVAYNGTNIITTGLTATQQQKPFNDNLTNAYDQIARTRVLDVDTQFNTANYSHHAVKAAKYTATGGLPFNSVAILQGGNVDDNSRLHCHDCHILNGHGTTNEYLLQNSASTIGANDATLHGISTYVCLKCHTSTYSTTTHTAGNGSDFVNTAGAVGATARAGGKTDGNITGISCTACHNVGGTGWGGIHGGNNTYTQGGGGTQSTYRFMPGMNNNGYTVTNWTAASSAISCYTNPTTNWGVCTSHTGGKTATVTRVGGARALSY